LASSDSEAVWYCAIALQTPCLKNTGWFIVLVLPEKHLMEANMVDEAQKWLTTTDAAKLLKCSVVRVRVLVQQGRIKARLFSGRYVVNPEDIQSLVGKVRTKGGTTGHLRIRRTSMRGVYRHLKSIFLATNTWLHGRTKEQREYAEIEANQASKKCLVTAAAGSPLLNDVIEIARLILAKEPNAVMIKLSELSIDCIHRNSWMLVKIRVGIEQIIGRIASGAPYESKAMAAMCNSLRGHIGFLHDLNWAGLEDGDDGRLTPKEIKSLLLAVRRLGYLPVQSDIPYKMALAKFDELGIRGDRMVSDEDKLVSAYVSR
jgi:hypothetical protein